MPVLFPAAIGVNRMLPTDGNIPDSWKTRLNLVFGTSEWEERFYSTEVVDDLFSSTEIRSKAPLDAIGLFFVERLKTIFAGVADNPQRLPSEGRLLYLLCFAAGNPKGAPIALRIARHLFDKKRRTPKGR